MPTYRDKSGKFTKFDRRKNLYNIKGELVYKRGKSVSVEVEPPSKPKGRKKQQSAVGNEQFISVQEFTNRTNDEDLYTYFAKRNINKHIAKLKKANPKKVIVASVEIKIGKRRLFVADFKLTDYKETPIFLGSNKGRKGKKYTPKDLLAYAIHSRVNDSDMTLYRYTTDSIQQVKLGNRKNRKRPKGKRYEKNQSFTIRYKAIPKRTARITDSLEPSNKRAKERRSRKAKQSRRR